MAQAFKETAHLKTDLKKFSDGWDAIWGKKEKSMKVFEFEAGEKDWVVAHDIESAKQCLIDLCDDYEEGFKEEAFSVKELTEEELKNLSFTNLDSDEEDAPDVSALEIMEKEKAKGREVPYHLGGTAY